MRPRPITLTVDSIASRWAWLLAVLMLIAGAALLAKPAGAQQPAADKILTPAELADVVGPIALYPDDLVGIVLPASTYPLQVVEAERFLEKRKQDPSLKPNQEWDDSVVALLNYPEVVHMLSDDPDWTWDLGTAVLNQRPDVLDAIQAFRTQARTAGNLRSDEHQTVTTESDGSVAIAPADPEVIYVPYYEPEKVVVYQSTPVYSYYPWAYPVYYYPYPAGYAFRTGFFFGVTSFFDIGWHSHLLRVHYYGHSDFPYFGHPYYSPFYVRNYVNVNINAPRGGFVWEPRHRYGDRPNVPIVRAREGRVADSRMPEPHVSHGVAGSASRYRTGRDGPVAHDGGPGATPPRGGGVGASASRYRVPQTSAPTATGGNAGATGSREIRPGGTAGGSSGYRAGGGMSQASRRNETSERFLSQPPRATPAPAPQAESRNGGVQYRVPAAPARQPQQSRPSPGREYRGMSSASHFAPAPRAEIRSAPAPRAEVHSAPAPRGGGSSHAGGSYRGGGGERTGGRAGGRGER